MARPSFIAKSLNRIEAGSAPGRIERRKQGERKRHHDHGRDLVRIHFRRHVTQKVDLRVEESRSRERRQKLSDGLDVLAKYDANQKSRGSTQDTDARARDQKYAHDGPTR